jgi:hypothetical protein
LEYYLKQFKAERLARKEQETETMRRHEIGKRRTQLKQDIIARYNQLRVNLAQQDVSSTVFPRALEAIRLPSLAKLVHGNEAPLNPAIWEATIMDIKLDLRHYQLSVRHFYGSQLRSLDINKDEPAPTVWDIFFKITGDSPDPEALAALIASDEESNSLLHRATSYFRCCNCKAVLTYPAILEHGDECFSYWIESGENAGFVAAVDVIASAKQLLLSLKMPTATARDKVESLGEIFGCLSCPQESYGWSQIVRVLGAVISPHVGADASL